MAPARAMPYGRNMSPPGETSVAARPALMGERTFWFVFALSWLGFGGILVSSNMQWVDAVGAVKLLLVELGPLFVLSVVVAVFRADLFSFDRSLVRMIGVQAGVAVLFATASALLIGLLSSSIELPDPPDMGLEVTPLFLFVYRFTFSIFVYGILAGFLVWTESLSRVHESATMAAREAALRAEAELKALNAQFNPHFVFNTLHSLMLLVRAEPDAAERAIEDVAALIRYASTVQREGTDRVSVAAEIAVARSYLALEKLRLADRLAAEWDVPDDLHGLAVPPFTVQSLVENAVKHGLSPRAEGGSLRVRVRRDGEALAIEVSDDGAGADAERVRKSGRGLDLLERRLAALYGDGAALSWTTAPGEGFSVEVRLPAERVHDDESVAPAAPPELRSTAAV